MGTLRYFQSIGLILGALIIGAFLGRMPAAPPVDSFQFLTAYSSPSPTPSPTPKPIIIELPQTLTIPKIGVHTNVEYVAHDQNGRMDVPQNFMNVGWYRLGAKVGEKGSAVLAGHLDTQTGAPAIFYNLNQLVEGDEVIVTGQDGTELKYKVVGSKIYDISNAPLEEIFAQEDKERLNLITCDGIWDVNIRNYTKRLVVFTELVKG